MTAGTWGSSRWRLPLRLARREALRHPVRSLLVLVLIALPVLAVSAADVLLQTSEVSGTESIERRMGAAQARVTTSFGSGAVAQTPDPDDSFTAFAGTGESLPLPTEREVSEVLGGARLLEIRENEDQVRTADGAVVAGLTELDLRDPLTAGIFDLRSGRWPSSPDEAVVNAALAAQGLTEGETLDLTGTDGSAPTVVGVAENASARDFPMAAGPLGAFGIDRGENGRTWLVDGDAVTWAEVRELNALGATVASRAVIEDPPPSSEWAVEARHTIGTDDAMVAVLVLIVVMALIEVVLLAGPAFAVGARRQQRSLALMSATGGTPAQVRRVVLASAVVLGGVAAALGVGLGIGAAWLLEPLVQARSGSYFGPFDVPWTHLLGVAGFGLLSAVLAAMVPAWVASRQDVVAVLAGRRGDRAPSLRSPALGVVLLGLGVTGSVLGAAGSGGELLIAASAIPTVLGMVLLIPLVLAGLGRAAGRLPLVLRYAVRDAARHRTRTVPAVAAVAATVAGVVALGVGVTSDEAENEATYVASLPDGHGVVTAFAPDPEWDVLRAAVLRTAPQVEVTEQLGVPENVSADADQYSYTYLKVPGVEVLLDSYGSSLGSSLLVSDGALPPGLGGVADADVVRAERALREEGIVAFASPGVSVEAETAKVVTEVSDQQTGEVLDRRSAEVPADIVTVSGQWAGAAAILSPAAAREAGLTPAVVGLSLGRDQVDPVQEEQIIEVLAGVEPNASVYVERGYQAADETLIAQLILIGLGAVLMLGGTLTATFLALSDARPDLATLSAIGASPRARRGIAAAYAVVIGTVGAVLGAAVGFIPGIAVTYPLTTQSFGGGPGTVQSTGPYLDVPWLMVLGIVVVLPVLTAAVVGLSARSRLPLVARLD